MKKEHTYLIMTIVFCILEYIAIFKNDTYMVITFGSFALTWLILLITSAVNVLKVRFKQI